MDSGPDLYIRFEADASPEYYQVVARCRALARERADVIHVETGVWPQTIHPLRFADPLLARRVWNRLDGGESAALRMDGRPVDTETLSRARGGQTVSVLSDPTITRGMPGAFAGNAVLT